MAIKANNALGVNSLLSPTGQIPTSNNFINPYTYAQQYQPDLLPDLYEKHGKGMITKFTAVIGTESSYASDIVQHAEMGRLHQVSKSVAVAGNTFTCAEPHNLRVGETIKISDGTKEFTGRVSVITSATVFDALNLDGVGFTVAGNVTLFVFSNAWDKGDINFTKGKSWKPDVIENYSHILKEFYTVNKSDMAHITWVKAPQYPGGEAWFNLEMGRTDTLYDNKIEMTHIFNRRAKTGSDVDLAGDPKGMKGMVQQIEERGNVGNEYIKTKADLYAYAKRLKQQGNCRVATIWADHEQMVFFSEIAASLSASYSTGANYGMFQNGKDMAISMDFKTIYVAGVTFHITPLSVLDDPSLLAAENFKNTSLAALIIPSGDATVTENGNSVRKPYFSVRYRRQGAINRYREVEIFGGQMGTPHKKDTMEALYTTEQTNQLIGANNYFVVRRGAGIYTL